MLPSLGQRRHVYVNVYQLGGESQGKLASSVQFMIVVQPPGHALTLACLLSELPEQLEC